MRDYLQTLLLVVGAAVLLWLGYSVLMGQWMKVRRQMRPRSRKGRGKADPWYPKVCPLCKSKLADGELAQTRASSATGMRDRLMHIQGCVYCVNGDLERRCPVCAVALGAGDKLVARVFDQPFQRTHLHIMGCFLCRKKVL